jgi:hypothetical protein
MLLLRQEHFLATSYQLPAARVARIYLLVTGGWRLVAKKFVIFNEFL